MIIPCILEIEIRHRGQSPCHSAAPAVVARKVVKQAKCVALIEKPLSRDYIDTQRSECDRCRTPIFSPTVQVISVIRLVVGYYLALTIAVAAANNHDEVHKPPDAATSSRQKLYHTDSSLSRIEAVDTKSTQEETQQKC